jgi:PQQ enzyme repeat
MFRAFDASTGAELWRKRLNDVPASVPIAYSVNGQDYIATVVGPGGSQSNAYVGLVPELQNPPQHGATLWVFEVPKKPGRHRAADPVLESQGPELASSASDWTRIMKFCWPGWRNWQTHRTRGSRGSEDAGSGLWSRRPHKRRSLSRRRRSAGWADHR